MNWKDIASAGKSVGKLDSLDVSEGTKDCMEAVMCAMAASGKVQEMALIAQTLEKVDTQVDLKMVSSNLNELVGIMKAQTKPIDRSYDKERDELRLLRAENAKLKSGLEM